MQKECKFASASLLTENAIGNFPDADELKKNLKSILVMHNVPFQ